MLSQLLWMSYGEKLKDHFIPHSHIQHYHRHEKRFPSCRKPGAKPLFLHQECLSAVVFKHTKHQQYLVLDIYITVYMDKSSREKV